MKRFLCTVAAVLLSATANAAVITFDGMPDSYFVPAVSDQGYTFTSDYDGLGVNNNGLWPSNGTSHLMSWSNRGDVSGFTLTSDSAELFNVSSFEFVGGYVSGSRPVESLIVSGWLGGALVASETFYAGVDFVNATLYSLLEVAMTGIDALTVEAFGTNNRAQYENFIIEPFTAVSEPAVLGLVGIGILAAALFRRRHQVL